jgi:multidrug efflux pump subunit AcrA (membrane-fusion protein)
VSNVDLSALHIDAAHVALPKRPWGPRLFAVGALLLVLAVAATFAWPLLRPQRSVPMAPVRAVAAATAAAAPIAEAVGWVEADPFPVVVRPLVAGRVESIDVLEGAPVTAGETVIARLASAAVLANHERAAAALAERERMLAAAIAQHDVATARLAQNAAARLAAIDARSALADKEAQLAIARGAVPRLQAEARVAAATSAAQEQLHAAGGANSVAMERARAAAVAVEAAHAAAQDEVNGIERECAAATARVVLAEELLDHPVDLEGAVALAAAEVERARASLAVARTELSIAEREREWTTVRAPIDGIVLRLLASPGASVGPDGEGVLALYDPRHLRARIDVPLGSVGAIAEGQPVELRSEVTGDTVVRGVVQRLQHESDLLKNTLQVKVGLVDPPPLLRPETLCRARFLGDDERAAATPTSAFLVPKAALRGETVFVFDPARRRARAVRVQVVHEQGDDVVVRGELSVTQRVVLTTVADGESVREETR